MPQGTYYCSYNSVGGAPGVVSQNFGAPYDAYNSAGAADFSLDKTCNLKKAKFWGSYSHGGRPAKSMTVTIYQNEGGLPGTVVTSQTVKGSDGGPIFTLSLKRTKLPKGDYFVSAVANLNYGDEWHWATIGQSGARDLWINPGDGFGTGCTSWSDMATCLGTPPKRTDFQFVLGNWPG